MPKPDRRKPNVVFLVYDGIVLLDLVGPLHVFSRACADGTVELAYKTHIASVSGGPVQTNTIVQVDSVPLEELCDVSKGLEIDTLVIVGGDGANVAETNKKLVEHVATLSARAKRICSVCCGAFVLAAAGLLDGRRAVTHWEDCALLARRFPNVRVEVDPIYIKEGSIWTSAGITAGTDMALAVVREDLGPDPALHLARSLVTPMIRSAGQSQFSSDLARQTQDSAGEFSKLHIWLRENLAKRISVSSMAAKCSMSARNFSRRYAAKVGLTPASSLEKMRVDAARNLLLETDHSIKIVARECGFGDQERMRRAFHRHLRTSPSTYQSSFRES
ncbi:GlxA family transcriptional regulator [Yoonia sp. SDW83-1]|uniref:GlxA family transcriptional regulator n=1 Tax=Yoonia sp. SDW83-1 TaxID=3366945 RepID=UPI00398C5E0C